MNAIEVPTMRTWTFPEITPEIHGPWEGEPDKAQWVDEVTGLDCLIVRNHRGALCGYVGVPPGHPWHGNNYNDCPVEVHGGLTYSAPCQDGAEDGPGICHVPEPGRPADIWWLGFDCAHISIGDDYPKRSELRATERAAGPPATYRTFQYVKAECELLASQIAAAE